MIQKHFSYSTFPGETNLVEIGLNATEDVNLGLLCK